MPDKDLQKKIVDRISTVAKEEGEEEVHDQEVTKEPVVPPATKVSIEPQTDFPEEPEKTGSSHQREEPASSVGCQQREGTEEKKKKDVNADDTAPQKKPVTPEKYGIDISGNEIASILSFKNEYYGERAGFYNLGFPALSQSQHMMWHKHSGKLKNHMITGMMTLKKTLCRNTFEHYDESVFDVLEGLRQDAVYGCSDPRMHIRERAQVTKLTNDAAQRHKEDFETLHQTIDDSVTEHGCIPYSVIFQLLAMRNLGAGLLDADFIDKDYPYRSPKSFLCMLWNLGNWQRPRFLKNPLLEHLEKYRKHINFDFDTEHRLIGDKPLYNNFFVNVVKNLETHLSMNCEAGSIFEHKERIEEGGYTVCFNDYQNLMVAARIGIDGSVRQIAGYKTDPNDIRPRCVSWAIFEIVWGKTLNKHTGEEQNLTRGRMSMHRVCVIMFDKTIFLHQQHSVERSLRPCVGSASTIKLM